MQTIRNLSLLIEKGKDSAIAVGNYLDEFKLATNRERSLSISAEPIGRDKKKLVYLAAFIEQLCLNYKLRIPRWVNKGKYFLKYPYFCSRFENVKPILIQESPTSFRRRNIFVSSNILSRV